MSHTPLDAGPLPVAAIEAATGLVLAPGPVHFSVRAQEHAERRHPDDFALCMRHVARIVTAPDYIGQGPHQADGFELVGEARAEDAVVLVAIKVRPDARGRYIVASTYVIDRGTLDRRLRKRFLART